MRNAKIVILILLIFGFVLGVAAQQHVSPAKAGTADSSGERVNVIVPDLLKRGDVPGISIAVIVTARSLNGGFGTVKKFLDQRSGDEERFSRLRR